MLTYDVRIWGIRARNSKSAPFQLRWRVGPEVHQERFQTKTQADGRRSELMSALRKGQQFDTDTGLPADELREKNSPTWYAHTCEYVVMKWPGAAGKQRASIAESLAVVTAALTDQRKRGAPPADVLRRALQQWAYQCRRDGNGELVNRLALEDPPEEEAGALDWLAKHSMKVSELADATKTRQALTALSLRLDRKPAAENTFRRKRAVFSNALRYAVERGALPGNPLARIDWDPPQTDDEVDFQYVPSPRQAMTLVRGVAEDGLRGEHLEAFFGCLYFAAMRPSEVADLKKSNCRLPDSGWGELLLRGSRPEVGSGWTDDGESYEARALKRRARKTTRPVPIPPVLVGLLREHLERHRTAPDGRLFRAVNGGRVRSTEYTEVWKRARERALTPEEVASPLAEVPYSLRHAGVSLWIRAGVDPTEVARRAGHSPAVLWRFYAKILRGQEHQANALIEAHLGDEVG
ncbi:site-specific integrase [Streptomyces sp. ST2-7A]|uniref:tyrosine-type recombinase/integrase n=1 Tax=Streptomyces sp. ST2-7A TaxID=2907214 RepID=UPI001F3A2C5B|nr:site-specific integrase [Streptomyces sp. ST2-7A]MCE7080432.1 site-specific integrase [Streptomyces sp. ST2-7A]